MSLSGNLRSVTLGLRTLWLTDTRLYRDASITLRSETLETRLNGHVLRADLAARDSAGAPIPGTFRGEPIDPPSRGPGAEQGLARERLDAGFLFYSDPWSCNFQHFLVELLPKMVDYLATRVRHGRSIPLLVPRWSQNQISREVFDLFGVSENVVILNPDTVYDLDALYSSGYALDYSGITPKLVHSFRLLRHRLSRGYRRPGTATRRIYLARDGGAAPAHNDNGAGASRVITNHAALQEIMDQRSFESVTMGRFTLFEKMRRLSGCEVLVSPMGANLMNCLLMLPPYPRAVVIICPDTYQRQDYMAELIRRIWRRRVEVGVVLGRALREGDVNSPYEVDPGAFTAALERCLSGDPAP